MSPGPERENHYPTFGSVWDDGGDPSRRVVQMTSRATWKESSYSSTWADDAESQRSWEEDDSVEERTASEAKSAQAQNKKNLFSPGMAATLWSASSRNLTSEVTWKCEECGHVNRNVQDDECAFCGTKIVVMNDLSSFGRHIEVDEDEFMDEQVHVVKRPSFSKYGKAPKKMNSTMKLKELLAKHPSFKKAIDGSSLASVATNPISNVTSAHATVTNEKLAYTQDYGIDSPSKDRDSIEFNSMGHPVDKDPPSLRRAPRLVIGIPLLLTLGSIVLIICRWLGGSMNSSDDEVTVGGQKPPSSRDYVNITSGQWLQRGEEIFGFEPNYRSGASVALGDNGRVVAIGVGNSGPVRAWQLVQNEWYQIGQDISFSEGAKHVALSKTSGQVMAVASETEGSVEVFYYDPDLDSWDLLGQELMYGVTNRDDAKAAVALSYDGSVLAIGVPSEGPLHSDSVRMLIYDGTVDEWGSFGNDVVLDDSTCIEQGGSVALSGDGMFLAVGSWTGEGSASASSHTSHAEVYRFANNTWAQVGGTDKIGSRVSPIKSDVAVSLSEDGFVLAIGSGFRCRAFHYKQEDDKWSQLGQDLVAHVVSLSSDGMMLAVGNPANDDFGSNSGEVVIYALDNDLQWAQVGNSIPGEMEGDWFGVAISLSDDGGRVAVGAPGAGDAAESSGSVAVLELV